MGWNYLSIPIFSGATVDVWEWLNNFTPTFYWVCNYVIMLGLKLNQASKYVYIIRIAFNCIGFWYGLLPTDYSYPLTPSQCQQNSSSGHEKQMYQRSNILVTRKIWSPFRIQHFQMHFLEWKCVNSDKDFTEICLQWAIIPALVQIMAWCCPGDKPLSGRMMVRLQTHICITQPQWVNALSFHA